ncbi:hypothetical protein K488DRAFT_75265 [Vararia minispora EC-137]|uniref:Uncharacterized protein n=1 Tax=Vararia minispora EC-137 TaxID=1314806 RepID=A0ACB8Q512_9AGAM|nr:hypothetical protein K488DRAFT_75265 [Vararia minispora EC-137]
MPPWHCKRASSEPEHCDRLRQANDERIEKDESLYTRKSRELVPMWSSKGYMGGVTCCLPSVVRGGMAADIRVTNEHWDVDFATHLLERSYRAPLRLTFLLDNTPRNRYTIVELEALIESAMRDHRARIWSLDVGKSGVRSDISKHLLRARLPDLHHLTIGPDLAHSLTLCVDELSEVTPSLTTLNIASSVKLSLSANGASPIFLNVARLELTGSPSLFDRTAVSWEFTTIVGRLPVLKVLILADYFPDSPLPDVLQPVELPTDMEKIVYRSRKPAYSIMVIDSLLVHNVAHRVATLVRADPRTLATVFSGARDNFVRRVEKGNEDTDHATGKAITHHSKNSVELRIGSNISASSSGAYHIRALNIHDSLALVLACIPLDSLQEMLVISDLPVRVLWRYLSLSKTLENLHIAGPTAQEFLNVFKQDARRFPALGHVCLAAWRSDPDDRPNYDDAAESMFTALERRRSKGMRQLLTVHVPWSQKPPCPRKYTSLNKDRACTQEMSYSAREDIHCARTHKSVDTLDTTLGTRTDLRNEYSVVSTEQSKADDVEEVAACQIPGVDRGDECLDGWVCALGATISWEVLDDRGPEVSMWEIEREREKDPKGTKTDGSKRAERHRLEDDLVRIERGDDGRKHHNREHDHRLHGRTWEERGVGRMQHGKQQEQRKGFGTKRMRDEKPKTCRNDNVTHLVHSLIMDQAAPLTDQSIQQLAAAIHQNPSLRPQVAAIMANRVEGALQKYFSVPSKFREAMGNARAALSGSWVLHFIMQYSSSSNPSWTEADLDIYCPEDGLPIMMTRLLEEGYYPSRSQQQNQPSMTFTKGVITRVLEFDHAERGLKVDVVCTDASTPFEVVLNFWTTLVINVVTVHDLILLYPDLMLAMQGRQPLDRARKRGVGGLVNKYIRRGFQVWPFSRQRACMYDPDEVRSTRDNRCLVLPMTTPDGYERGPQGSTMTMWRMRGYERAGVNGSIAFVNSIIGPYVD